MEPRRLLTERLKLRLTDSPWGPYPESDLPDLEGLAGTVHAAVDDQPGREKLEEIIAAGEEFWDEGMYVAPCRAEDRPEAATAWLEITGIPLDGPLCYVGMHWLPRGTLIPRAELLAAIAALRTLRERERIPPPWLFRPDPVWPSVEDPREREMVEAIDFEDVEQLEAFGLTSPIHSEHKRRILAEWGLPVDIYEAALEAQDYLRSEERKQEVPWAAEVGLAEAPVSLDLFRAGLFRPPGVSRFAWAAFAEYLLDDDEDDGKGDEGSVMLHDARGWVVVLWKRAPAGQRQVRAISLRGSAR